MLYPNPGYPIYESQIEYFGGDAAPYRYVETADRVRDRPRAPRVRDLITRRHDGAHLQRPAEPARLPRAAPTRCEAIADARRSSTTCGCCDEAYFEMRYSGESSTRSPACPGMRRAHRHPLHVLEEVRDDRLAARVRHRAACRSPTIDRQAEHQRRDVHHPLRAVGRGRGRSRRPVGPGRRLLRRAAGPTRRGGRARQRRSRACTPRAPTRPSTCSPTSPRRCSAWVSATSASSPPRRCTTPACRSAPAATSAGRSRARPQQYIRLAYSGISSDDITEGLGLLRDWVDVVTASHARHGRRHRHRSRRPALELLRGAEHEVSRGTDDDADPTVDELLRRVAGADAIVSAADREDRRRVPRRRRPAAAGRAPTSPSATTTSTSPRAASAAWSSPTRRAC